MVPDPIKFARIDLVAGSWKVRSNSSSGVNQGTLMETERFKIAALALRQSSTAPASQMSGSKSFCQQYCEGTKCLCLEDAGKMECTLEILEQLVAATPDLTALYTGPDCFLLAVESLVQ